MPQSIAYPLIFLFGERVCWKGSLFTVSGAGRAILSRPEHGPWMIDALEPTVVGADGETPEAAHLRFALALRTAFADTAMSAPDPDALGRSLAALFTDWQDRRSERWVELTDDLRMGRLTIEAGLLTLPRMPASMKRAVSVTRMEPGAFVSVVSTNQVALAQAL